MLRRHSAEEKSSARRWIVIGAVALAAVVGIEAVSGGWFAGAFLAGIQTGNFSPLWEPPDQARQLETLVVSLLLPVTALILLGVSTYLEDREVRGHSGPGPIWNPVSVSITLPATALVVGGIVLAIRQAALLIWD